MTKYLIRIKNDMYGYERDYIMPIEADSQKQALAIARNFDCYANITIAQPKETKMNWDQIDNLIRNELEASARGLADTILQGGIDYEDEIETLGGILITLDYYSTRTEYSLFLNSLPEAVLDLFEEPETRFEQTEDNIQVITPVDSDLAQNLKKLGFQAYMAMAELGFVSFESIVNLAKSQLQSNGTK